LSDLLLGLRAGAMAASLTALSILGQSSAAAAVAGVTETPSLALYFTPIDAGVVPIDAGHRRPIRPPIDAGRTVARDAAPAAEPVVAGFGALIAKHKGDRYLNVVIDGRIIGPTPMFGQKIATGTHVVELVDAKTSEVVVKRTIKVELGATVSVVEP